MRKPKPPTGPERERSRKLDAVAKAMAAFKPAREVLTPVLSVPTCMVQLDHALRVGGWPIERVAGIHGPSHEGKSQLVLLLARSFVEQGGVVHYRDAEHTTEEEWARRILGPVYDSRSFSAERHSIYEDVVEDVQKFLDASERLHSGGAIPGSLVVVDSIRKLIPRDLLKKVMSGDHGIDGASGRAEQIKARYNAAWLDALVPASAKAKAAVVFVLREHDKSNASARDRMYGNDYEIGGGKSVRFDSSLLARVTRASWVTEKRGDDGPGEVFGERHRVTISKSKVASKDGRVSVAYFHSSNGKLVPVGHDRARDVLDLAKSFELVEASGSWLSWGKRKIAQGEHKAVVALTEDSSMLDDLEAEVRGRFSKRAPMEYDPETGEVA